MEERGLDYEVETLPFPARAFQREFLDTSRLGTVPHFVHGDRDMTESTAICFYLVEKYNGEDDEGGRSQKLRWKANRVFHQGSQPVGFRGNRTLIGPVAQQDRASDS
jgi:glutathione S-transferase